MATRLSQRRQFRERRRVKLASPQQVPYLSIVAPAHNEEQALPLFVQKLARELAGIRHEIIIVDDGSTDRTWHVIQQLKDQFPQLRGIRFTRNFGHQSAILAGLLKADGEAVITMDSDGQHPETLVPTLVEHWRNGNDVVQAVRIRSEDEGVFKRTCSALFYRVLVRLSGVKVPPGSADFRLLSRTALTAVLRCAGPQLFLRGLIPWMGFTTSYVPFVAERRLAGTTSYTLRRMIRLSLDGLMTFSIIPLRMAIALGLCISGLSFLYLLYVIFIWLTSAQVVHGWASMTGLLSLVAGIQLLTIGVLGEYVGRLFISNLDRPQFVITEQL